MPCCSAWRVPRRRRQIRKLRCREFGSQLSDADIAAIINYERSSWGNHGKLVTAQDVAAVRAKGK